MPGFARYGEGRLPTAPRHGVVGIDFENRIEMRNSAVDVALFNQKISQAVVGHRADRIVVERLHVFEHLRIFGDGFVGLSLFDKSRRQIGAGAEEIRF